MTDTPAAEKRDYRDTVFLPKTDFPMKAGLPAKEPVILERWKAAGLYDKLRDARRGREKFIFHDGPPYANGDMHIGHALNHILKDMVVRTQTLLGKDAPYVPGWDCHGLPIEWKVEEAYRKKKLNKDEVPASEFRAECRAYAKGWVDTQREQLKRLGINADWDHPYLTMDFEAEATIVSELMKFADSGQLYRGAKPVMWSPVEKTALAEAEVEYEDIVSTQIDVAFEIVESAIPELVGAYAVIWTTTPWTIPVNQALAYGPEIEYTICEVVGVGRDGAEVKPLFFQWASKKFIVATALVEAVRTRFQASFNTDGALAFTTGATFKGSQLAGTIARHPMHHLGGFFARPRPFLAGDFVTTETGTGLVHMSPDHGEDDFLLCKANGIEPVFAVEADGKYRADWAWLGGQGSVINAKFVAPDGPICNDLRDAGGLLAASADYKHSYPHSWRSKAKVIFRCTPQWFIPMDEARDGGGTLRDTALQAITDTRWIPEKGRNRINAMVEGRPDWVISRQRAWGVPITLFVDRKTGAYLNDPAVNTRIVAAVREQGVDAWTDEAAQGFLGDAYDAADYERQTDILDVWFDSGCTHVFVLESGKWPDLLRPKGYTGPPADLYLEGSDQHRGWFQSSLLESCGTRGHAPYKAVLTHGFTMDAKGMKMSKSLGNTIDPQMLMKDSGADILRLWALSIDFTEDNRIGKEILSGISDQYRKLRNTFRYLLGALEGFSETERVPVAEMPELERYVLHLLADMDAKLRIAVDDFDFNTYVRLLSDFANNDLSAFFFDIRKDSLYCDVGPALPGGTLKRRAYRTVLDTVFEALVRWAAPVLVFTAEEAWGTRHPEAGSVHLQEWPEVDAGWKSTLLGDRWLYLREMRAGVTGTIEPMRRDKTVGSSLEAVVVTPLPVDAANLDLAELLIVSEASVGEVLSVTVTTHHKCGRCWRHLPEVEEDGDLCNRCTEVVGEPA
ncbi:isoleucine--tRNA ligase [Sphingomonas paeninsulae]|uniref:Isoleucine--tRNA ligase n=1 Tax=Sphingomonas paeninsulae TaxID=2319844 RepID=A0A494TNI3_SPHPE|nr:isoleucine--tRNA ligase [Sphingomonas paeninsulae]AYJ86655.1 isoleucine--tRNA ligase [Sphingomonas paeninsulae]